MPMLWSPRSLYLLQVNVHRLVLQAVKLQSYYLPPLGYAIEQLPQEYVVKLRMFFLCLEEISRFLFIECRVRQEPLSHFYTHNWHWHPNIAEGMGSHYGLKINKKDTYSYSPKLNMTCLCSLVMFSPARIRAFWYSFSLKNTYTRH